MVEQFAKSFEKMCDFCATLNFIVFGIVGGVIGYRSNMVLAVVLFLVGIFIAYLVNVLCFGLISQIIEIRKGIQNLDYMFSDTKFDSDIAEIKNSVSKIENNQTK